jgi:hypothetical protein
MRPDPVASPSLSTNPTPSPGESFETISPGVAAAIIATGQLAYATCKFHSNGKDVVFIFHDPLHIGEELLRRYTSGIFPLCHAKMLAEAHGYLADERNRVKGVGHARKNF